MALNLAGEQLAEAREVFAYFDTRGDDRIAVADVGNVLRALGKNPTEKEIQEFCLQWKNDPESRITFEQFLPIYQNTIKIKPDITSDDFVEGLSHFDKEGNGFISVAELRHLLTTLGERMSEDEVDQLLQGQEDSQGNVNISDFVRYITSG